MPWGRCQADVRSSERRRSLLDIHLGLRGFSLGVEGRHYRLVRVKVGLLLLGLSGGDLDSVWHLLACIRYHKGRRLLCRGC